jgi:hypothetical protein
VIDNTTVLTCSYNTPTITITMLKSFVSVHGIGPHNIIISENSTTWHTSELLDKNGIKHILNKGSPHSQSIDKLFELCTTKYALLVDTDIIFKQPINRLIEVIEQNGGTILGEICGSRGGYMLHDRINPWFCLINIENIKKNNIKFHDQKRIEDSKSELFYKNIPINYAVRNTSPYYDVGSTFYEDIINAKLKIINAKGLNNYFTHYEGSSWHRGCGNQWLDKHGQLVWEKYKEEIEKYKDVDIKNQFVGVN